MAYIPASKSELSEFLELVRRTESCIVDVLDMMEANGVETVKLQSTLAREWVGWLTNWAEKARLDVRRQVDVNNLAARQEEVLEKRRTKTPKSRKK